MRDYITSISVESCNLWPKEAKMFGPRCWMQFIICCRSDITHYINSVFIAKYVYSNHASKQQIFWILQIYSMDFVKPLNGRLDFKVYTTYRIALSQYRFFSEKTCLLCISTNIKLLLRYSRIICQNIIIVL